MKSFCLRWALGTVRSTKNESSCYFVDNLEFGSLGSLWEIGSIYGWKRGKDRQGSGFGC